MRYTGLVLALFVFALVLAVCGEGGFMSCHSESHPKADRGARADTSTSGRVPGWRPLVHLVCGGWLWPARYPGDTLPFLPVSISPLRI
ncbi:MAG: hypothetical protein ACYC6J_03155 [Coriobacteriia bacterium]